MRRFSLYRRDKMTALRLWLAEAFEPAMANRHLMALKGTMRVAWQLGQIDGGTLTGILGVRAIRGFSGPLGRSLTTDGIRAVVEACLDGTFKGGRDLAAISLGYCGCLRRSEIVALDADDVKAAAEAFMIRVHGKGGQERLVFINNGGAEAIRDFLSQRGEAAGALFHAIRTDTEREPKSRLTATGLFRLFRERAQQAMAVSALSGCGRSEPHASIDNDGPQEKGRAAGLKLPYHSRKS